jgi:hypothetical protein
MSKICLQSIDCSLNCYTASTDHQSGQQASKDNVNMRKATPEQHPASTYSHLDPATRETPTVYQPVPPSATQSIELDAIYSNTED